MTNDLLTQLRHYGTHLDELSQSVADVPNDAVRVEFAHAREHAPMSRRRVLGWSAAAAAAVAAAGTVRWLGREPEPALGDQIDGSFAGPVDTPLGRWVRLGAESEAFDAGGSGTPGEDRSLNVSRIIVAGDRLVAVGSRQVGRVVTAEIWTSPDASRWERWRLSSPGWSTASDVVAFDGRLAVAGFSEDRVPVVWIGDDPAGMTRVVIDTTVVLSDGFAGLVRMGDELVLFAGATESADGANQPTWRSKDGTTWVRDDARVIDGRGAALLRPVWDGATLVAPSGRAGGDIARSTDRGRTWTLHDLPHKLDAAEASRVVATSNGFVAVGDERTFESGAEGSEDGVTTPIGTSRLTAWTSPDGISWARVAVSGEPTSTMQSWNAGVARGGNGLAGLATVLTDGVMHLVDTSSADGSTWTLTDVDSVALPNEIVAVDNGFVAIGSAGVPPLGDSRNLAVWFRRDR